jgi:hypothetical protein
MIFDIGLQTSVERVAGYGATEGASVVVLEDKTKKKTVVNALKELVAYVQSPKSVDYLSKSWLDCCGFYRCHQEGMIRLKINKRPFLFVDAEHVNLRR